MEQQDVSTHERLLWRFFFSSRRRHTRFDCDWSSDVCSSDLDVASGRVDLKARGFWRAVAAVKPRADLVERYGARIAVVDRRAFLAATPLVVPAAIGAAVLVLGTIVGIALIGAAFALPPDPAGAIVFLLGAGALVGATHGLAH